MSGKMRVVGLICVLSMVASLQASTMDDAFAWYKLYNGSTGGTVLSTQIVDSIAPAYPTSATVGTAPTWATCDAVRDGSATTDDRAVSLAGVGGIKLFAAGTSSFNNFLNELYGTHTDLAASGSFTMFLRVLVNEGTYAWDTPLSLISSYAPNKVTTGAAGVSFRLAGSSTTSNPDSDVVRLAVRFGDNSAYTTLINNGLDIKIGEWADVALSYDAVNGKVLMTAYDSRGFESVEFDYSGMVVSAKHFTVGTSLNSALSGYTSYLPGSIESFAMWNKALTASEIESLSVPEPATLTLIGLGFGCVMMKRRK